MGKQEPTQDDTAAFGWDEAARRLGVSTRMVRNLVENRMITHRKVGSLVRFTPKDIENYLDANRREALRGPAADYEPGDPPPLQYPVRRKRRIRQL